MSALAGERKLPLLDYWPLSIDEENDFLDYLEEFDHWMAGALAEDPEETELKRLCALLAARDGWI